MAVSAKICQQLAILDRGAAKLHGLLGPTCSVCSPHTTALSAASPLIFEEVSGLFSLNTCRNLYVLEAGKMPVLLAPVQEQCAVSLLGTFALRGFGLLSLVFAKARSRSPMGSGLRVCDSLHRCFGGFLQLSIKILHPSGCESLYTLRACCM